MRAFLRCFALPAFVGVAATFLGTAGYFCLWRGPLTVGLWLGVPISVATLLSQLLAYLLFSKAWGRVRAAWFSLALPVSVSTIVLGLAWHDTRPQSVFRRYLAVSPTASVEHIAIVGWSPSILSQTFAFSFRISDADLQTLTREQGFAGGRPHEYRRKRADAEEAMQSDGAGKVLFTYHLSAK